MASGRIEPPANETATPCAPLASPGLFASPEGPTAGSGENHVRTASEPTPEAADRHTWRCAPSTSGLERVLRARERPRAYVAGVRARGGEQRVVQVGVLLDEARHAARTQAGHVLPDEHLGVAVGTGADADSGDLEPFGDLRRDVAGNHLHYDCERSGFLQRLGFFDRTGGGVAASLDSVAAEIVLGLRCESDVGHDRDPGVGEQLDLRDDGEAAFELDAVYFGFLHEPHGGVERLLG